MLGTTIFGTVLATRVGDVLVHRLTGAGVPAALAPNLLPAKQFVAQGGAPVPAGAPEPLARAITLGSHLAFMDGFRIAFVVGGIVAVVAALAALLVRRSSTAGALVRRGSTAGAGAAR